MKTLPLEKVWTGDGCSSTPVVLTQVNRNDKVALYSRRGQSSETVQGYELIVIGTRLKGQPLPGGNVEAEDREVYPSATHFGKTAFALGPDLNKALKRFDKLTATLNKTSEHNDIEQQEETPVMETQPTSPTVSLNEAKKLKAVNINLPDKEFTMQELMVFNSSGRSKVYFALQDLIQNGTVVEVRRDQKGKGRATVIYGKASV